MLPRDCVNHLLVDCEESKEAVASGELNPETALQSGVLIPHFRFRRLPEGTLKPCQR